MLVLHSPPELPRSSPSQSSNRLRRSLSAQASSGLPFAALFSRDEAAPAHEQAALAEQPPSASGPGGEDTGAALSRLIIESLETIGVSPGGSKVRWRASLTRRAANSPLSLGRSFPRPTTRSYAVSCLAPSPRATRTAQATPAPLPRPRQRCSSPHASACSPSPSPPSCKPRPRRSCSACASCPVCPRSPTLSPR